MTDAPKPLQPMKCTKCRAGTIEVLLRNGNRSAFNGYRFQSSLYSCIRCTACGHVWRSKGKGVALLPDRVRSTPTKDTDGL